VFESLPSSNQLFFCGLNSDIFTIGKFAPFSSDKMDRQTARVVVGIFSAAETLLLFLQC
jgi:hypothetical protein